MGGKSGSQEFYIKRLRDGSGSAVAGMGVAVAEAQIPPTAAEQFAEKLKRADPSPAEAGS
jgi:hypothetical protein